MKKRSALTLLAIAGGLLFLYGPALLRWLELQSRRDQLDSEIALLTKENQRLYEEARRLREDPTYAEAVARRELGLVRPGETVVKFQEPSRQSAGPSRKDE